MKKYLIVFNPNAANGAAAKRVGPIRDLLGAKGISCDFELTREPLHAISISKEGCGTGYSGIIAAGGDGTANEVLNGIMASATDARPVFGMLSIGRGNDFAYGAGIPRDIQGACDLLAQGVTAPMDVGRIIGDEFPEGRYFGNGIGVGFDAMVNIEATKLTWAQGFLGYFIAAMKTMFFYYEPSLLEIEYNGKTETKAMIQISAMNGSRMGGAFYMTPDAKNDDGYLDLCIAHEPRRGQMLGIILRFMKGTQVTSPHILFDRTQALKIRSADGKLVVQADGEVLSTAGSEVKIACIHHAVRVIRAA